MSRYVGAIWKCRYFWLSLVKMDLRTRYRGSLLGLGWSLLQPLAMTAILCAVFHTIFKQPILEYGPYVLAGLACWNFLLNATLQGCTCFHQAEAYIRQYPAPLAIYPLRTALAFGFHFLLALFVVVVLSWVFRGLDNPLPLLSLIPTCLLLVVFAWSLAVLGGLANVHFPDTRHLAEVLFQGLFYLTPIIYPPEVLRDRNLDRWFQYNPLVSFLDLLRSPILRGAVPSWETYLMAVLTVVVLAGLAAYTLRRLEHRFIFHL